MSSARTRSSQFRTWVSLSLIAVVAPGIPMNCSNCFHASAQLVSLKDSEMSVDTNPACEGFNV
jgi:hypothetical protein